MTRSRREYRGLIAFFLAIGWALPFRETLAQSIRGRVFLADSSTPASFVIVSASEARGTTVKATRANERGEFALTVPAGTYRLKALRIGQQPTYVNFGSIGPDEQRTIDIVLTGAAVKLDVVQTNAADNCGMSGADGDFLVKSWDQARAALASSQLTQSGRLTIQVVALAGLVDKDGSHLTIDSETVVQTVVHKPIWSTSAAVLTQEGYVRARSDGDTVFDGPNAEVLLSDDFISAHCFRVESSSAHPKALGIGFRPATKRDVTDVSGTLWLNRETAELEQVDFRYTGLMPAGKACDGYGLCTANDRTDPQAGGSMVFKRLGDGEWIIARWKIRTPADTAVWREMGQSTRMPENAYGCRGRVVCYGRGVYPKARLRVHEGFVEQLLADDSILFRDPQVTAMADRLAAKRAGKHSASFEGYVFDAEGGPIKGAVVRTTDPARAAITDSAGFFSLRSFEPKAVRISVDRNGFQRVVTTMPLIADSTRHIRLTMVRSNVTDTTSLRRHLSRLR